MRDSLEATAPEPDGFRIRGHHVLGGMVAFFGIVFAVNGYMLMRALATHSGVVAVEPYRRGLAYNERIEADGRQAGLGWRDSVVFSGSGASSGSGRSSSSGLITVLISGRDDSPVSGLALAARLGRPATAGADKDLAFHEESAGRYVATTGALAAGAWILNLEVRSAGDAQDPVYRARRRLWLKP